MERWISIEDDFARGVGTASFAATEIFEYLDNCSGSKDTVDDPTPATSWLYLKRNIMAGDVPKKSLLLKLWHS